MQWRNRPSIAIYKSTIKKKIQIYRSKTTRRMSHFVTAKFYMYVDKRTELRNISLHFRRRVSSDIYIVCESRRKCYEESIEFLFSFIISSIRENGSRRKYFFVLFLFIFSNFFFFFCAHGWRCRTFVKSPPIEIQRRVVGYYGRRAFILCWFTFPFVSINMYKISLNVFSSHFSFSL